MDTANRYSLVRKLSSGLLMAKLRSKRIRRADSCPDFQPGIRRLCQRAFAFPLATVEARLQHGALGVWDEVAVGVLLVGCAIAYVLWFFVSGRNAGPSDSD